MTDFWLSFLFHISSMEQLDDDQIEALMLESDGFDVVANVEEEEKKAKAWNGKQQQ